MKKYDENKGITLIALVISIIVLLVLVGVSISMLTGQNGILRRTVEAKEKTDIEKEKEYIKLAYAHAKIKKETSIDSDIEQEMQQEMDSLTGQNKTNVIVENGINVVFKESDRIYVIKENGEIKQEDLKIDENPGNIKKGIKGETLEGDEKSPYEIWSIEDLVELSQNISEYKNSHISIMKDLDFSSKLSYSNYKETKYGDINNDGESENLLEELKKGEGFTPIQSFDGVLDGKNHSLYNLYINKNQEKIAFIIDNNGTIKNLSIIDGYINGKTQVATLVVNNGGTVENVDTNSNVIAEKWNGGIIYNNSGNIKNTVFSGTLETTTKCTTWYKDGQRRNSW